MKKTTLAKTVAMVLASSALSMTAATATASTTMYNTFVIDLNPEDSNTDGWTYTDGKDNQGLGTASGATVVPWVGTAGGARPFGYTGASALNWAAHITNAGDSLTISAADAASRYNGVQVDIDSGKGAWKDTSSLHQGWAHNTDIGLFKSDVTTKVSLTANFVNNPTAKFGITLFTGQDTGTTYTHHKNWNNPPLAAYTKSNPFNTTGVTYQAYGINVDSTNAFEFIAEAGQIYSIYLGGYLGSSSWLTGRDFYQLNIATSPVPVPAAAWLFGSGLFGLMSYGRRKKLA
ncbi:MAG: VPLPA-CTERM sorting domain-containing protein [Methylobacter sp.]|nr:VPLPA-CTERM sorting domain-containing protein [Methylococcales bacterium]MDD5113390.1 VPLPA-CTERM sorting domain-containing protein [Methylobacter sp.]